MRRGCGRAWVAGAALAVQLIAVASWGQPPGSIPPVYTERLQIPVRGDDLRQPRAVVADLHSGEIFVCDALANRIAIFDPEGRFRYEIRGGATFQSPIDLAVDPEGYLFVVSQASPQVTLLDFDGRLLRRAPLGGLPEEAVPPRFASLAISPAGDRLYLMDAENDRLWITDSQLAVLGSVDITVGRTPKEIEELRYGQVDVYGETVLLPIPNDGLVYLYDLEGGAKGTIGDPGAGECQLMLPAAAALDQEGRVLILDQQRALFMTWELERGVCLSEHYGFGNAPGAFYQPSDMALDAEGRLYVSQGFEGRVQVYEGARPAPVLIAALAAEPEIVEESLVADAETGAVRQAEAPAADEAAAETESRIAVREPVVPAPVPTPVRETVAAEAAVEVEVEQAVRAWARAWADKSVEEYLWFYSAAFQPPREMDRSAWQRLRRSRLERPRWIEVTLDQVEPRLTTADKAQVAFVQTYRSNLYTDKVDKILTLAREEDGWKILAERVVKAPIVGIQPAATSSLAELQQTVNAWARAWAGKRIEEYLSFYSQRFAPARGLSRSAWEQQRRVRLDRPRSIEVSLERIEARLAASERAEVSFVQTYRSNLYADKVDKSLTLVREADGWKILAERVVRTYRE